MMQEPHPSGTDQSDSAVPHDQASPGGTDQHDSPAPRDETSPGDQRGAATPPVEVAVERTGGFAGLTKQWRAEPPVAEASTWIDLISRCPWDAPDSLAEASRDPHGGGADRFTWRIQARCGEADEREAELGDAALVGAWRELVDAVRTWGTADGR